MPFSRLMRMRSRTSAMSASRSIGFGSPMWPKSNDGAGPARGRDGLGSDGRDGARPPAARADRVFAPRSGAPEASLMHAGLVGADPVLAVGANAVDPDGPD